PQGRRQGRDFRHQQLQRRGESRHQQLIAGSGAREWVRTFRIGLDRFHPFSVPCFRFSVQLNNPPPPASSHHHRGNTHAQDAPPVQGLTHRSGGNLRPS